MVVCAGRRPRGGGRAGGVPGSCAVGPVYGVQGIPRCPHTGSRCGHCPAPGTVGGTLADTHSQGKCHVGVVFTYFFTFWLVLTFKISVVWVLCIQIHAVYTNIYIVETKYTISLRNSLNKQL